MLKEKIFNLTGFSFNGNIKEIEFDGVYVKYDGCDAIIGYKTTVQKARCYFMLSMKIKNAETNFELKENPCFETCGPMIDAAKTRRMTVDGLKKYVDYIAALGLNMLMIYTEDVFEMPEYPRFGYMRGRYTQSELKQIDDYAYEMGVELIPCIQTLGHLQHYLKWPEANDIKESKSVLLPNEEKTYEFIECQIKTMRKCLRSNRIHLGMDEAVNLGKGTYLERFGPEKMLNIFNAHLKRVQTIAEKYNYETMIWSDMYFAPNHWMEYYNPDSVIPQEAIDSAPEKVKMVFWDYYHTDYDYYHKKLVQQERFKNNESAFAGAVWTFDGHAPNFRYTYDTTRPALEAAINHNVKTVIATVWNEGDICNFKSLDGLCTFSEVCYKGKACTEDDIYNAATHITGQPRDFIDAVSEYYLGFEGAVRIGSSIFYSDPMLNLINYDIDYEDALKRYTNALNIIDKYKQHEYHAYYHLLFKIVSEKTRILKDLKREYKAGNMKYITELAQNVVPQLQQYYRDFYSIYKEHWLKFYKPVGFEDTIGHFGAIDYRLTYMIDTLNKYIDGNISVIDELEEEVIGGINQTWTTKIQHMSLIL